MSKQNSESVPQQMQPIYDEITHLTDAVCRDHVDEEFAMLCRKLAAALARKQPSPLARGKKEVWACAIVYALGARAEQVQAFLRARHANIAQAKLFFGVAAALTSRHRPKPTSHPPVVSCRINFATNELPSLVN